MRSVRAKCALGVVFVAAVAGPGLAQDAARVASGQKVYASAKCAACHSIAGTGNTRGPLDGVGSRLTADELRLWLVDARAMTAKTKATRKPPMPSYPKLSAEELDGVVAYLQSLKP